MRPLAIFLADVVIVFGLLAAVIVLSRPSDRLFVVVDGRSAGYSRGVTMSELAQIFVDRGAKLAYNLDGGGSSAIVLARPDAVKEFRAVNRPSDPTGERAVGNALAIVKGCRCQPSLLSM